jgi:hypothetical protein
MSVEDKLDEFIRQSNSNRQADLLRAKKERLEDLAYIAWGFGFATLGFAVSSTRVWDQIISFIIVVLFAVFGFVGWSKSRGSYNA